jgi:hypothetical protein
MESMNPMDNLNLLEQKVLVLLENLKTIKEYNTQLVKENQDLMSRLETVETSLLKGTQNIDELNQERMLTKMVVEELISNIEKSIVIESKDNQNADPKN